VAASSFVSFAAGAVVPVLPWLVASGAAGLRCLDCPLGRRPCSWSGPASACSPAAPSSESGARQLLVGGLAAAATFGIGRLIGVSVS
jgi:VIT1/CCC1 family predicted Fe2+/Mn2+ transporter